MYIFKSNFIQLFFFRTEEHLLLLYGLDHHITSWYKCKKAVKRGDHKVYAPDSIVPFKECFSVPYSSLFLDCPILYKTNKWTGFLYCHYTSIQKCICLPYGSNACHSPWLSALRYVFWHDRFHTEQDPDIFRFLYQ